MRRLWFITNPGSGTATAAKCAAIEAVFDERGLLIAGRTHFPEQAMPAPADLAAANADTVVLFAGDGTINAGLCALADWDGAFLILPGGTMNLLARTLHAATDPARIVHEAHTASSLVPLPFVEAGPHRAFVGLILGPAAHWFRAREAARKRRGARMLSAVRNAWRRTFGRGIRIAGIAGLRRGYQAIFVHPAADGIDVAGIDARDWRSIAELGWTFAMGRWADAGPVTQAHVARFRIDGTKRVLGLFDGEPVMLDPGTSVSGGISRPIFIQARGGT